MTDIVAPPAVIVPPTFPDLGNPAFNALAYAWGTAMPGVSTRLGDIGAAAYQNATAAQERATAASDSAGSAAGSAAAAALDAARLATLDALWLGASATDPTTGRGGAPLVAGNAYINTGSGAVRAYTGSAWVQGIAGGAGVASINGQVGALVLNTLAAYGITDIGVGAQGAVNLNTLTTSGMYTYAAASNAPPGAASGTVFVVRSGSVLSQIVVNSAGSMYSRGATGIGGAPVFSAWRRGALHADEVVALAGGDADCSLGNYFTETVSASRALAFVNVPAGAYSCVVEINHTAGSFTLPAGSVYANGSAPTFAASKRHLLFFQRAQLGTAGWYVSTLPNFAS